MQIKTSLLIILLLLFTAISCYADENKYAIGYAPLCIHTGNSKDYSETPNAVFGYYNNWVLGTYTNSIYNQSVFAGYRLKTKDWYVTKKIYTHINLYGGLLYGYGNRMINVGGIAPMIMPTLETGIKNYSIELMANMAVVSLMFKYSF